MKEVFIFSEDGKEERCYHLKLVEVCLTESDKYMIVRAENIRSEQHNFYKVQIADSFISVGKPNKRFRGDMGSAEAEPLATELEIALEQEIERFSPNWHHIGWKDIAEWMFSIGF